MATSEVVAADWLNALLIEVVLAGAMKSNTSILLMQQQK
jgi:hypothetical protein